MMTAFPVIPIGEDVTRQVLADAPDLMVVAFRFAKAGATGALHRHPHVQATYVASGWFRFTIHDTMTKVGSGDSFIIHSGALHGVVCLAPGTLIDSFTPRRDDFL